MIQNNNLGTVEAFRTPEFGSGYRSKRDLRYQTEVRWGIRRKELLILPCNESIERR